MSKTPQGFAKVFSAQTFGLDAHIVTVETDVIKGLHSFSIVGLPDKAVEESRDRVSAAIRNAGFDSPKKKNKKIVISLAPADVKKEGPAFDMAVALAYLSAVRDITFDPNKKLFLGELSLDGSLRPVKGVLPLTLKAKESGFKEIYVPKENAKEAALVKGITIFGATHLNDVIAHLRGETSLKNTPHTKRTPEETGDTLIDFSYIRGQEQAKRALEIAAAGSHNIALFGPPGTGKSMLAKAFAGILPRLTFEEALEVTSIHSVAGMLKKPLIENAPFRSPHHTSSYVAVVGGGAYPRPGEVTLAHRGVLFLDEFPEFDRRVIEALREPLEEGVISISRSRGSALFPSKIILVASMNPCPCGYFGTHRECRCTPFQLERYKRKLSGPLIDRIDIWVSVGSVSSDELLSKKAHGERSEHIRERIEKAQSRQRKRFEEKNISRNSEMGVRDLQEYVPISHAVEEILKKAAARHDLSARAHHKVIKLARTIADLSESNDVEEVHMLEALQYRPTQLY